MTRPTSTAPHGTRARYLAGCVCIECRHANTAASRDHRARMRRRAALNERQLPKAWALRGSGT